MAGETDPSRERPVAVGESRRHVLDRSRLPSGRAAVGGLLLALSSLATFVAWERASGMPDQSYVVTERPLAPGERPGPEDLRLTPIDLPDSVAAVAFQDVDAVVGRVALGPIGAHELVQAGQVSEGQFGERASEVSFALPRDRALDGRLRSGDLVDVFATFAEGTTVVAEAVRVVAVSDGRAGFTDSGEVTVTLALPPEEDQVEVVHAVRAGEVTLVRSTYAGAGTSTGTGAASTSTSAASTSTSTVPAADGGGG
jgi:Flp pilus assembly protein CpaB